MDEMRSDSDLRFLWEFFNSQLPEEEQLDYPSYLELRKGLRIPLHIIDRAFSGDKNEDGRNN